MNSISQKAKEIFVSVVDEVPPEEWDHRVDEACQGDDELRRRVHALLLAHAQPDSRLDHVAIDFPLTLDQPITEKPGNQIGPYNLLQQIGEGGMGVVYMAEQKQPVKRRVALKIIKPGMDTRQVIARFEAERQALAMMDHPNIAKVLDAGATASGRPYFVMELVNGLPVTKYCDEQHLTPKERLELFVPICLAVQHAHQKGIIHRDLKPSNILVALYDGNPVPKIIDFGVAKATSQTLTENTMFTQLGQIVGTLDYMSPEQVERNQLDIDTRSDIYSLGVVLYELLTGDTPFDRSRLRSAAFDEMLRIIREEEPPRLSTKLSSSQSLASIAANRRIEPARLGSMMRGDLDWIVLKAMEKDRGRRYETASKFAEDVQHYLNDEPVVACPPSSTYRFRKFLRRNKGRLVISGMMAAALLMVVGSVGWAVRDRSARQAKFVLERQEREAELAQQSEVRLIRTRTRVEALLSEIDRLAEEQRWDEALAVAKRAEVAIASDAAEEAVNEKVRSLLRELEFVARLTEIRMDRATIAGNAFDHTGAAENYAQAFRDFGVDVDVLTADDAVARLKRHLRIILPVAAALDDFVFVRRRIEKSSGREVDSTVLIETARKLNPDPLRNQLRIMWGREVTPELQATLRQLVDSFDDRRQGPLTAERLADTLRDAELPDLAEHILRDAQQHFPGDFWLNHSLGSVLLEANEHLEAVRFFTAALGIKPESPAAHINLGVALCEQGKRDEGIACFHKAIELDSNYPKSYHNLGSALTEQGKLEEAITCFQKAIKLDPKLAMAHYSLGLILAKQEKLDDAIACLREAIKLAPNLANANAYFNLGLAHARQGNLDDAIPCLRKAIELDPNLANAYYNLGLAHARQGNLDDAIPCLRKAIELDPNSAMAQYLLGMLLMDLGSRDEAESSFRRALELEPNHVNSHFYLGRVLARNGQIEEAIAAFRKSLDVDPNNAPAHNDAAWLLATAGDVRIRNPQEAIGLARRAVQLDPKSWPHWNTLSVAAWRAGEWQESLRAREEAIRLNNQGNAMCWNKLGMAMLRWHLGQNEEALNGYDQVREQVSKLAADNPGLQGFWEEAKALLGIPNDTPNAEVEK